MKIIKRYSLIFFSIILIFACIPIETFAIDPASTMAVASMAQAYGMQYGIQTGYANITTTQGLNDFEKQWDDFNDYLSNNNESTYNILDVYNQMKQDGVVGSNTIDDIIGNSDDKYTFIYSDSLQTMYTKFWDFLLSGVAEMEKVDNQYYQFQRDSNNQIIPIELTTFNVDTINGIDAYMLPYSSFAAPVNPDSVNLYHFDISADVNTYFVQVIRGTEQNPTYDLIFICLTSTGSVTITRQMYTQPNITTPTNTSNITRNIRRPNGVYNVYTGDYSLGANYFNGIPIAPYNGSSSITSALDYYDIDYQTPNITPIVSENTGSIILEPTADNSDGRVILPMLQDLVGAEDLVITLDIPVDNDEYGEVFPLPNADFDKFVNDVYPTIVNEEFDIVREEADQPTPPPITDVLSPFIPVNLPSFNFNFSGIWHYVREWVSSLGAWLVTMFSVWNNLPYAMIVPVYASIVIVIVLGVYKRFFM